MNELSSTRKLHKFGICDEVDIKGRKGNLRHKRPYHQFFIFLILTFFLFVFQLKRCSINREIINSKEIKSIYGGDSFCSLYLLLPSECSFFCSPQHCNIHEEKYINFLPYTPIERSVVRGEEAQIENQITDNLKRLSSRKFIKFIH